MGKDEVPCCACGEPVGLVAINGTKDTYAETACGRCGRPLCDGCSDDAEWQCNGSRCCPECCEYFALESPPPNDLDPIAGEDYDLCEDCASATLADAHEASQRTIRARAGLRATP